MELAVLGGGHGSYAAAATLTEQGHQVRFWRRNREAFEPVLKSKSITVLDSKGKRDVEIHRVTTNLAAAVDGVELIVIPLPASVHESLARELAPHLEDGQVVYLPPGTFGSYLFARAMRDAGNPADASFAETGTLPYLARKRAADLVAISGYATRLPSGVFPAKNSQHAFPILEQAYPVIERIEDALSGALMNAGPIIHPPLIMMNAGPMEHFDEWDIHNEGTQPAIRRVTDVLDSERIAMREAFGYAPPHFPLADHYSLGGDEWMYGNAAHERLTDSADWREYIDLINHRYMTEDMELGLALLVSCADYHGLDTPVSRGLLALGSAITGRDFRETGRTLGNLGLAGMDRDALAELLYEGIRR